MAYLTIIIFIKNEEQNLEKCITSFKSVAQRVVIIDSYSTNNTIELAKLLGAEVYEHPFENHAVQFNWTLNSIDLQTKWGMKLDADEEFTSELTGESVEETLTSMQAKVKRFVKNYGYYSLPKFFKANLFFIYRYYFRLGFLDETEGKIYAFLQAYWYWYLVDIKLHECKKLGSKMEKQGALEANSSKRGVTLNNLIISVYIAYHCTEMAVAV